MKRIVQYEETREPRPARHAGGGGCVQENPLFWLGVYIGFTVIVGALLAWPLHRMLDGVIEWPFYRVARRATMAAAIVALPFLLYGGGAQRARITFGADWPTAIRSIGRYFGLGLLTIAPLIVAMLALGVRTLSVARGHWFVELLSVLPFAALTGIVVGIIEEAYFRGVVLGALLTRLTAVRALVISSVFFAALHFLIAERALETVEWYSGFWLVAAGLSEVTLPENLGAFLALVAAGLLLGAMRIRDDNIGACVGFHAGWVVAMTVVHRLTDVDPSPELAWLVGRVDGFTGWLALPWIAILAAVVLRSGRALR